MSTYTSTDMDIELADNGDEERTRRLRKPTSKGKAYNVQRKHRACINIQTKITKHINKIDLAMSSYDNCHIVKHELDLLFTLTAELKVLLA